MDTITIDVVVTIRCFNEQPIRPPVNPDGRSRRPYTQGGTATQIAVRTKREGAEETPCRRIKHANTAATTHNPIPSGEVALIDDEDTAMPDIDRYGRWVAAQWYGTE